MHMKCSKLNIWPISKTSCLQNLDSGEGSANKKKFDPFAEDDEAKNPDIDVENNDKWIKDTDHAENMSDSNCDKKDSDDSMHEDAGEKENGATK